MHEAVKIQKEQFPTFVSPSTTYSTIAKITETTLSKLTNDNNTNNPLLVPPGDA